MFKFRQATKKIYLVIGPSCSGKSAYINYRFNKCQSILMAHELENNPIPITNTHIIVHYNTFRVYKNSSQNLQASIDSDIVLQKILESGYLVEAFLLVTSVSNLIRRACLREFVEPQIRRDEQSLYPSVDILFLLNKINLERHYQDLISYLNNYKNVKLNLIDSNDNYKNICCDISNIKKSLLANRINYSPKEIDFLLNKFKFEYHKINLPFGKFTQGQEKNFNFFDKFDFYQKSVLDVGCAYGSLCFYAEGKGAKEILGTELKPHRYLGSIVAKSILNSKVNFTDKNIFFSPLSRQFDIVLFLNVIHHIPEPFYALKILANLTRQTLIVEFPNTSDPKFRSTLPKDVFIDDRLPLVGVSSKNQDQTFVFNRSAIKRYMEEHLDEFSIEFYPSTISDSREIMTAHRLKAS